MVTHIVIFTWLSGVTDGQVASFRESFDRMTENLATPITVQHGPDLRFRDGNGDYALVALFPDREAWAAYQADPAHKAFVRDFVGPMAASRISIQF
jgi:hypothetical protein